MTKEIYISSTPHETRLAVVEDDQLAEIYYERENEYTLAGSVYKGKVTRVLPGMQSAFVEIGLERDAFLYVTDFAEEQEDGEEYVPLSQGKLQSQNGQSQNGQSQNNQTQGNQSQNNQGTPQRGGRNRQQHAAPPQDQEHREQPAEQHSAAPSQESSSDEAGEEGGSRHWRGRRGRRRGRGNHPQGSPAAAPENSLDDSGNSSSAGPELHSDSHMDTHAEAIEFELGEIGDPGIQPELLIEPRHDDRHAAQRERSSEHHEPAKARQATQETFVLPGESLSKYRRGQATPEPSHPAAPAPIQAAAPKPSFQPSTMITAPLAWDGSSDVLPGETLSRRKSKPAPAAHPASSPAAEVAAPEPAAAPIAEPVEEFEPLDKIATFEPAPALQEHALTEHPVGAHPIGHAEQAPAPVERNLPVAEPAHSEPANFEPEEASASYRVDPAAPSAYRQSSIAEPVAVEPAAEESVSEIASSPDLFAPVESDIVPATEGHREE
ncbi:MAG: hypothetical protein ABI164_04935, partial [Acidobacteriaceae bacterium]